MAVLVALFAASISPLVPAAAALDPTAEPSTTAVPTEPASTAVPTPDPAATPSESPALPTPAPEPIPSPTPEATLPPATLPPATPPPATPLPAPSDLVALADPDPLTIVLMSLIDPSLPSPHTLSSLVADGCNACHATHASADGRLLETGYRTDLKPVGEAFARAEFALCFSCHEAGPFEAAGTGGTNFDLHAEHLAELADGDTANAVCAECHNRLHGTAAEAGGKLVSFSPNVTPNSAGDLVWTGTVGRSCSLTCHGYEHVDEGY
ncbi:MAG: cytochrome c3 family protein [Chloroflexota bacterium]